MLSGVLNDGKTRFGMNTHMGSENMRIRTAVYKKLSKIKSGTSFKSDPIHISPEYMDKLVTYLQDYSVIQRSKANKSYNYICSERHLGLQNPSDGIVHNPLMNAFVVQQDKVVISLCEAVVLEPVIASKWHLTCRVNVGHPVNGRPTTRILEGCHGNIRLTYNYGQEMLYIGGDCTTEIPLANLYNIPCPLVDRPENLDIRHAYFIHNLQICKVVWTENLMIPTDVDSFGRVKARELKEFIWCLPISQMEILPDSFDQYSHYQFMIMKHNCFLLNREDVVHYRLSVLHGYSLFHHQLLVVVTSDVNNRLSFGNPAANYLLRTLRHWRRKNFVIDADRIAKELDYKTFSKSSVTDLARIFKFTIPCDNKTLRNTSKSDAIMMIAKEMVAELNRYQIDDIDRGTIHAPPSYAPPFHRLEQPTTVPTEDLNAPVVTVIPFR
jgi:hypothetical protein